MVCPHGQGGRKLSQCGQRGGGVKFPQFCVNVFYGRPQSRYLLFLNALVYFDERKVYFKMNNQFLCVKLFLFRYSVAARDLVLTARGTYTAAGGWRMPNDKPASVDDISVYVIPLLPASRKHT